MQNPDEKDAAYAEGYAPEGSFMAELLRAQEAVGYSLKFSTPMKFGEGFKR